MSARSASLNSCEHSRGWGPAFCKDLCPCLTDYAVEVCDIALQRLNCVTLCLLDGRNRIQMVRGGR